MSAGVVLPAMPWNAWPGMDRLLEALGAAHGDTRLVGGAVRDTLLAFPVSDVDLATRLVPGEVIDRLRCAAIKAVPTGIAHGTVTAVIGGRPVEVTTLRRDLETDGRHATVAFTDDWQADAARRDFTINALGADPLTGEVFDHFGGLADLAGPHVRFIGDPFTRIAEDHLRILRFFRFHARFGRGDPDPVGMEACVARAPDLAALSRERIADELFKLLALPDPAPTLATMVAHDVFVPVLPEFDPAGAERLAWLIDRETAAGVAAAPIRRLAALLPPDGESAPGVATRLRLSNALRARLICGRGGADFGESPEALAYRHGRDCAIDRLLLASDLPAADLRRRLHALTDWRRPALPVTGGQLIARGLTAGPIVARTLSAIEEEWISGGFGDVTAAIDRHVVQALRDIQ